MNKADELVRIKKEMEQDPTLPLAKGATRLVFGRGNPDAQLLLIGEAPGYFEDQQGLPFVGNAGKLLDVTLKENELNPATDVYITNVVHHRPPGNRDPLPYELAAYRPYLERIIATISPPCIATLGRYSMAMFLPSAKISRVHGQKFMVEGRIVVPMFHPAAALRSEGIMTAFRNDFAAFVRDRREEKPQPKDEHSAQLDLFS